MIKRGNTHLTSSVGTVMVLASGAYAIPSLLRRKVTYRNMEPEKDPKKDGPESTFIFFFLAVLLGVFGFLLLGLGIFGLISPLEQGPAITAML